MPGRTSRSNSSLARDRTSLQKGTAFPLEPSHCRLRTPSSSIHCLRPPPKRWRKKSAVHSSDHWGYSSLLFSSKDGLELRNKIGACSISPLHGSGTWKCSSDWTPCDEITLAQGLVLL